MPSPCHRQSLSVVHWFISFGCSFTQTLLTLLFLTRFSSDLIWQLVFLVAPCLLSVLSAVWQVSSLTPLHLHSSSTPHLRRASSLHGVRAILSICHWLFFCCLFRDRSVQIIDAVGHRCSVCVTLLLFTINWRFTSVSTKGTISIFYCVPPSHSGSYNSSSTCWSTLESLELVWCLVVQTLSQSGELSSVSSS